MQTNIDIIRTKEAYRDIIDFISGQITQAEFIKRYTTSTPQSPQYNSAVIDVLQGATPEYNAKFAATIGMQGDEIAPLRRASQEHIAKKLVSALFQVAYTRTPNNKVAPDGQPATYTKKYNSGAAAIAALTALGTTTPYTPTMQYVYDEYFFPYIVPTNRRTGFASNDAILCAIRRDARLSMQLTAKLAARQQKSL